MKLTEKQSEFIELIKRNKNIVDIQKEMNLSDKRLMTTLHTLCDKGYNIIEHFDSCGNHTLQIDHAIFNGIPEINEIKNNTITLLAISDTHLTSKYADRDALDKVYQYAISEGISYIIHTGDLIDNLYVSQQELEKQLLKVVKEYPKDKSITTFYIQGNHDLSTLKSNGIDLSKFISSYRFDLVPLGIDSGKLKINNSLINLCHRQNPLNKARQIINDNSQITLRGHSHIYKLTPYKNLNNHMGIMVQIPCLCNMMMESHENILEKGFVKLKLNYGDKNLKSVETSQYMITDRIMKLSEYNHLVKKII